MALLYQDPTSLPKDKRDTDPDNLRRTPRIPQEKPRIGWPPFGKRPTTWECGLWWLATGRSTSTLALAGFAEIGQDDQMTLRGLPELERKLREAEEELTRLRALNAQSFDEFAQGEDVLEFELAVSERVQRMARRIQINEFHSYLESDSSPLLSK